MKSYTTLVEAINDLKAEGYTWDFNLESDRLYCKELSQGFFPDEFEVVEYHRFEGESNPADSSILFAIKTKDGKKGVLLDAYGAYAGEVSPALMQALKIR